VAVSYRAGGLEAELGEGFWGELEVGGQRGLPFAGGERRLVIRGGGLERERHQVRQCCRVLLNGTFLNYFPYLKCIFNNQKYELLITAVQ